MSVRLPPAAPCHFGRDGELVGFYHGVAANAATAVLLCPPLGQELIRSHRCYRQLAEALATRGIASLRFDYHGSGDSAGDSAQLDWIQCKDDVVAAAAELRLRSGCSRIVGFGARLGGTMVLATALEARFAELIVWDPILDGAEHAAQLDALQRTLRDDTMRFTRPRSPADVAGQWLGFAVSDRLHQQIETLQVAPPGVPMLLLDSSADPAPHAWDSLAEAGARVKALRPAVAWDALDRLEHAILSPGLAQAVTDYLGAAA